MVAEPATLGAVRVTRGEAVAVMMGLDAVSVREGVNMACNVSAAAVWTSFGGENCSNGMLQASMARIRPAPASTDLKFCVMDMYSFLDTARWETFLLFYHFSRSDLKKKTPRRISPAGFCLMHPDHGSVS